MARIYGAGSNVVTATPAAAAPQGRFAFFADSATESLLVVDVAAYEAGGTMNAPRADFLLHALPASSGIRGVGRDPLTGDLFVARRTAGTIARGVYDGASALDDPAAYTWDDAWVTGLPGVYGLASDGAFLYVSQFDGGAVTKRALADGALVSTLATRAANGPTLLALDTSGAQTVVYGGEFGLGDVFRVGADGTGLATVADAAQSVVGVSVDAVDRAEFVFGQTSNRFLNYRPLDLSAATAQWDPGDGSPAQGMAYGASETGEGHHYVAAATTLIRTRTGATDGVQVAIVNDQPTASLRGVALSF